MLFVFGDSFSHDIRHFDDSNALRIREKEFPEFISLENNWVNLVAKELTGTTEQVNESMAGCANEFIFHKLMNRMPEFKKGDYVIISLTASNRRWLIERCPHLSNWANSKIDPNLEGSVTKSEHKAITQYARYLHFDVAADAIYNATYWAIVHAAVNLEPEGVKVLILPGFEPIRGVHSTLTTASAGEFDSIETLNKFYTKTNDARWNHFSEKNHQVLANKICRFFRNYEPVDLSTEFEKNIYTKDNI